MLMSVKSKQTSAARILAVQTLMVLLHASVRTVSGEMAYCAQVQSSAITKYGST